MTVPNGEPVRHVSRGVSEKTRLFLYVRAGGYCEFDGCHRYLLLHYPTFEPGNFAQMAHIYAFNPGGPRGNDGVDAADLNHISNLILLCPQCHKLIDDHPDRFPVAVLRNFKRAHEDRIFMLTGTNPGRDTVALRMIANIGDHAVQIAHAQMQEAVAPFYFNPHEVVDIDLTNIADQGSSPYWKVATREIERRVSRLYDRSQEDGPVTHISIFALAPIPLLIFLGNQLSNKIPTAFFQRHRDTQSWEWKEGPPTAEFTWTRLRNGTDAKSVAVMYSLSGRIHEADLPATIDNRFSIYELALSSEAPNPRFLNTEADLGVFRASHSDAIRALVANHEGLERVHIFPAVPAPVAVSMGWELLPKRDPSLLVFDSDKRQGGFQPTIEVNPA